MTDTAKKKVLIAITKSNFGGAQKYVYDIARGMKDTLDVSVVCGGRGPLVEKLEASGIRTIALPSLGRDVSVFADPAAFWRFWKLLRAERPDILHTNSSKMGAMGALAGRLSGIPRIVFTAHGWAFNEDRGLVSKSLIRLIYWLTVSLSHETIAVSEAIRHDAPGLFVRNGKVRVIRNGIESAALAGRDEARAKLPDPSAPFVVGTVAELHSIKGLSYALDAFSKLKDLPVSYVIWGGGSEEKNLRAQIERLDLKEKVTLAGTMPDAARYMKAFDAFLLPSLSEALGYVILEAGLAELPVIATGVGGIPEIIEDMRSGVLIHPKNPDEIARAVRFMYENADKRALFARNLRESVAARFSYTEMVAKTREAYLSSPRG